MDAKDKANKVETAIKSIDEFEANAWTRVSGKERVYAKCLKKTNGGKNWHGGCGWCGYLDVNSGEWHDESWAGASTRKNYQQDVADMMEMIANI